MPYVFEVTSKEGAPYHAAIPLLNGGVHPRGHAVPPEALKPPHGQVCAAPLLPACISQPVSHASQVTLGCFKAREEAALASARYLAAWSRAKGSLHANLAADASRQGSRATMVGSTLEVYQPARGVWRTGSLVERAQAAAPAADCTGAGLFSYMIEWADGEWADGAPSERTERIQLDEEALVWRQHAEQSTGAAGSAAGLAAEAEGYTLVLSQKSVTGYKHVVFSQGKYRPSVQRAGKNVRLGAYETAVEAAVAVARFLKHGREEGTAVAMADAAGATAEAAAEAAAGTAAEAAGRVARAEGFNDAMEEEVEAKAKAEMEMMAEAEAEAGGGDAAEAGGGEAAEAMELSDGSFPSSVEGAELRAAAEGLGDAALQAAAAHVLELSGDQMKAEAVEEEARARRRAEAATKAEAEREHEEARRAVEESIRKLRERANAEVSPP